MVEDRTVFHNHGDFQPGLVGILECTGIHHLAQSEQFCAGLRQVQINWIDLLDGSQQRCFVLADQSAFRHHLATDSA